MRRTGSRSAEELVDDRRVWRARGVSEQGVRVLPGGTGQPALDAVLPGGGWPTGALIEILAPPHGGGLTQLVLPALARVSAGGEIDGGWISWVSPPHVPYAPALAAAGLRLSRQLLVETEDDAGVLWAMEQALRSSGCGAVLGWLHATPAGSETAALRRLQLAAASGDASPLVFLFRPTSAAARPSPAVLRLEAVADGVRILKCRGGGPRHVPFLTDRALQEQP